MRGFYCKLYMLKVNTKEDVQDPSLNQAANYIHRRERLWVSVALSLTWNCLAIGDAQLYLCPDTIGQLYLYFERYNSKQFKLYM